MAGHRSRAGRRGAVTVAAARLASPGPAISAILADGGATAAPGRAWLTARAAAGWIRMTGIIASGPDLVLPGT